MTSTNSSSLESGNGDTAVVFLHYFGGAAESWQWVVEALPETTRCVSINLPGFGDAPPLEQPSLQGYSDYVQQSIRALGIEKIVLVGHSMGGKVALQVAAEQMDELQQVVLIAPSPPTTEPMPAAERERLLQNHPSAENAETTLHNASKTPLTERQQQIAVRTHTTAAASAWQWWIQQGINHSIADQMSQVKVPVTVLASEDDPVIPFETIQREVMDLLPQARLVKTSGYGHLIPLECPDLVAHEVSQVANQALGQSRDTA